jgi:hypothetical protein
LARVKIIAQGQKDYNGTPVSLLASSLRFAEKMIPVTHKRLFVSGISIYIAHHSSSPPFHYVSLCLFSSSAKLKTSSPFFFNFIFNFFAVTKVLSPTGEFSISLLSFYVYFSPLLLNSPSTSRRFLYLVAVMITRVENPLAVTTGNLPRQRLIAAVKGKVYISCLLAYSKFIY